ncbi:hypothetical protein AAG570_012049 [Ranatra chinensis]|uniref:Uncharacterized protein n=1 Tax=Ranatra chinensis TaxID=642074 RepID=A0ABD0Z3Z4_9HEMI
MLTSAESSGVDRVVLKEGSNVSLPKLIVDGNAKTEVSNRKEPGLFCGETEQPQTFISETSFVKLQFHTDNFTDQTYFSFDSRAEQQFDVYLRYGQHPELYPNRRGQIVPGIIVAPLSSIVDYMDERLQAHAGTGHLYRATLRLLEYIQIKARGRTRVVMDRK